MSEVEETNPLENMIDFAANSEFNKANDVFNDILMTKVHNAMEQEKVSMAQSMWGDAVDDSSDEDLEFSDDDLDQAAEEAAEDEDFEFGEPELEEE
jgi:hypothetical protein